MPRMVVIGLGVQGAKRHAVAGADVVATVDPCKSGADFSDIGEVPLDSFDAALVCIPDEPKLEILSYLLSRGKHVLVEKPLWTHHDDEILRLQRIARENQAVCYTAYNHRFEPHFARAKETIASGELGRLYHCRMFYGNGTARLVSESEWRDQGGGVVPDLGSHLLDTILFWFGKKPHDLDITLSRCFENRAPDHVVAVSRAFEPTIELEMTLLSWRNHFTLDLFAERGSLHIRSLCKWGPSTFTQRTRMLPSGRPPETQVTLVQDDPTWALEYAHFCRLCCNGTETDLSTDLWLNTALRTLSDVAVNRARS